QPIAADFPWNAGPVVASDQCGTQQGTDDGERRLRRRAVLRDPVVVPTTGPLRHHAGSVIDAYQIEPVGRGDLPAAGTVRGLQRGFQIVCVPPALTHTPERTDHRTHLIVQER